MHIMLCYQAVLSHKTRDELAQARSNMIKDKGFESAEYIKQLIADCDAIADLEAPGLDEVCQQLNLRADIVVNSQEAHIGQVQQK